MCSRHDIAEILLKLALNTNQLINQPKLQSEAVTRRTGNTLTNRIRTKRQTINQKAQHNRLDKHEPHKTWGELMCSRMENPTPDTRRVAVTRTSQTLWQTNVF
jgi:hypothetical protein